MHALCSYGHNKARQGLRSAYNSTFRIAKDGYDDRCDVVGNRVCHCSVETSTRFVHSFIYIRLIKAYKTQL